MANHTAYFVCVKNGVIGIASAKILFMANKGNRAQILLCWFDKGDQKYINNNRLSKYRRR